MKRLAIIYLWLCPLFLWGQESLTCLNDIYSEGDYTGVPSTYPKTVNHGILHIDGGDSTFYEFPLQIDMSATQVAVVDQDNNFGLFSVANFADYASPDLMATFITGCEAGTGADAQTLSIADRIISISEGNSITIPVDLIGTDDQEIDTFYYDNVTKNICLMLEDANTICIGLSELRQTITLNSNTLQLSNGGGSLSLTDYLDNTDGQTITTAFDRNTNELNISISGGNTTLTDINFLENDSVFLASPAAGITAQDLIDYAVDEVNDADSDPSNELDTLSITAEVELNAFKLSGNVTKGNDKVIRYNIVGGGSGSTVLGSDDQIIETFAFSNDTLSITIEDGNTKEVVLQGVGDVCKKYTGIVTSTYTPTGVTLPANVEDIEIELNGVGMTYNAGAKSHVMEFSFAGQLLQFFENLEADDILNVCAK